MKINEVREIIRTILKEESMEDFNKSHYAEMGEWENIWKEYSKNIYVTLKDNDDTIDFLKWLNTNYEYPQQTTNPNNKGWYDVWNKYSKETHQTIDGHNKVFTFIKWFDKNYIPSEPK